MPRVRRGIQPIRKLTRSDSSDYCPTRVRDPAKGTLAVRVENNSLASSCLGFVQ